MNFVIGLLLGVLVALVVVAISDSTPVRQQVVQAKAGAFQDSVIAVVPVLKNGSTEACK